MMKMMKATSTKTIVMMITLIAMSSTLLMGCNSSDSVFYPKSYDTSLNDIDSITIDVRDRNIEIIESSDNDIHIAYSENAKEFYEISTTTDKKLTMESKTNKTWTDFFGLKSSLEGRTIQLALPQAGLRNLHINTTNNSITIPAMDIMDSVEIIVNKGDIHVTGLEVGSSVRLEAKDGDITGTIKGSYDDFTITSNAHKGSNNLPTSKTSGTKHMEVRTNNGNINVEIER